MQAIDKKDDNPTGILSVAFLEFTLPLIDNSKTDLSIGNLFHDNFAFQHVASHKEQCIDLYRQGEIDFIINYVGTSFAGTFSAQHGPSVCGMGLKTINAEAAFNETVKRGAKPFKNTNHNSYDFPAIYGIGDSLIYFLDDMSNYEKQFKENTFNSTKNFGLKRIDHATNNVYQGDLIKWQKFYESIFNFRETRYFDIKGKETGLISKVMTSPGGTITIPINEPIDTKSQIQEYLDEYKGEGIQHIALETSDIIHSVTCLRNAGVEFLDVPDTYYDVLLERIPLVTEDINILKDLKILVDGDDEGYLLQIFTKNVIGPIFFEIIQRKNHSGFGEGNFQALFDAIERDQKRRGYL